MNQRKYLALLLSIFLVTSTAFGWAQGTAPATTRTLSTTEQKLVESISIASTRKP